MNVDLNKASKIVSIVASTISGIYAAVAEKKEAEKKKKTEQTA